MRAIPFICAGFLFLALAELPMGYFTFLRIVTTIGAIILAVRAYQHKNEFNFWSVVFALVAVLFNPIIPVYLHDKSAWMPIDAIAGLLFLINGFTWNKDTSNE